jgi:hypothetical protein
VVQFESEAVVEAADVHAALRLAVELGATDVLAIIRED